MQATPTTNTPLQLRPRRQQHLLPSVQLSPHSASPTAIASLSELQLPLKTVIVTIEPVSASSPLAATLQKVSNSVSPTAISALTEAFLLKTVAHPQLCLLAGRVPILTSAMLPTTNLSFKARLTACLLAAHHC